MGKHATALAALPTTRYYASPLAARPNTRMCRGKTINLTESSYFEAKDPTFVGTIT
jgi:hypothetical protein